MLGLNRSFLTNCYFVHTFYTFTVLGCGGQVNDIFLSYIQRNICECCFTIFSDIQGLFMIFFSFVFLSSKGFLLMFFLLFVIQKIVWVACLCLGTATFRATQRWLKLSVSRQETAIIRRIW